MEKTIIISASVPKKTGNTPGTYDTSTVTPKLNLPVFSSIFLKSITVGTTTTPSKIDVATHRGSIEVAELTQMSTGDSFGSNKAKFSLSGFDRVVLSNGTASDITVDMVLSVDGEYKTSVVSGGGGGGVTSDVNVVKVASDVKVKLDPTSEVAVNNLPALGQSIPVKIPAGVAVAIANVKHNYNLPMEIVTVKSPLILPMEMTGDNNKVEVTKIPAISVGAPVGANSVVGKEVSVGTTPAKIMDARSTRANVTVQGDIANKANIALLDPTSAHNTLGVVYPGGAFSFDYSGELWAKSTAAGQKAATLETFSTSTS